MASVQDVARRLGIVGQQIGGRELASRVSIQPTFSLLDVLQRILRGLAEPPAIVDFTISPRQIARGSTIAINWRVNQPLGCTLNVRLTQRNFHTDATLAQRNGLDASGTLTDRPDADSNYYLDALCADGRVAPQRRISVGVSDPPPENLQSFCFKVVFPASGICSTFAYLATSQSQAEQQARLENPSATITSINCSQMTTACGG
jgi:hypothetical protein